LTSIKSSLVFAFLCLALLVGSAFAAVPATELLYVQQGQNIISYSVNTKTAVTKKLSTLRTAYNGAPQITIRRSGSFLYLLGFSPAEEYFTVYSLTSAGVPKPKPVQTLIVKPALSQFYIHPNGVYAYAMFSWTGDGGFVSDIVLFTINPKTGKLTNTKRNIANFPPNEAAATSIDYMNSKGTTLFTVDNFAPSRTDPVSRSIPHDPEYYSSAINAKTGLLSPRAYFYASPLVLGDSIFVVGASRPPITVFSTSAQDILVQCDSSMLMVCGDDLSAVYIHPSDKYLFLDDQSTNEVPIVYISTVLSKLEVSGASIPGIPATVAFSPDGLLVYAVEGSQILTYVFNPHSGLLTARTVINAPGVRSILPWQ
jgi:hypothetical protein